MYHLTVTNYGIALKDNEGIALKSEDYGRIFDFGYKGGNFSNLAKLEFFHSGDSSGIGLALSHEIARKHGGELRLDTNIVSGLCVPFFDLYCEMLNAPEMLDDPENDFLTQEYIEKMTRAIEEEKNKTMYYDWKQWKEINRVELIKSDEYSLNILHDMINESVVKYVFTLSIPHVERRFRK
jgi:hypothetical protein